MGPNIDRHGCMQGTYTAAGLDKCRVLLNSQASDARPKAIVLITDGHPTLCALLPRSS